MRVFFSGYLFFALIMTAAFVGTKILNNLSDALSDAQWFEITIPEIILSAPADVNLGILLYLFIPFIFSFYFGVLLFRKEFVASKPHLRFGWVITNALSKREGCRVELHPVFGSIFRRIGGAVGVGSTGLISTQTLLFVSNGILAYHGIAHDAGGFLQNSFGIRPGYQYAYDETPYVKSYGVNENDDYQKFGASMPLTGQISGILYWANCLKDKPQNFDPAEGEGSFLQDCSETLLKSSIISAL